MLLENVSETNKNDASIHTDHCYRLGEDSIGNLKLQSLPVYDGRSAEDVSLEDKSTSVNLGPDTPQVTADRSAESIISAPKVSQFSILDAPRAVIKGISNSVKFVIDTVKAAPRAAFDTVTSTAYGVAKGTAAVGIAFYGIATMPGISQLPLWQQGLLTLGTVSAGLILSSARRGYVLGKTSPLNEVEQEVIDKPLNDVNVADALRVFVNDSYILRSSKTFLREATEHKFEQVIEKEGPKSQSYLVEVMEKTSAKASDCAWSFCSAGTYAAGAITFYNILQNSVLVGADPSFLTTMGAAAASLAIGKAYSVTLSLLGAFQGLGFANQLETEEMRVDTSDQRIV